MSEKTEMIYDLKYHDANDKNKPFIHDYWLILHKEFYIRAKKANLIMLMHYLKEKVAATNASK